MGNVIQMPEKKPIPPKRITGEHAGQHYTVTFDPYAPKGEQWVWYVDYVRRYRYLGACSTAEAAARKARILIHRKNKLTIEEEESE